MLTLIAESLGSLKPPSQAYSQGADAGTGAVTNLENMLSTVIGFLTILAGLFFVVYFLMAAISWIGAGGDVGKISKARDQIIQGVIGLIVIIAAYSVIGLIGSIIGLDLLRPGLAIMDLIKLQ